MNKTQIQSENLLKFKSMDHYDDPFATEDVIIKPGKNEQIYCTASYAKNLYEMMTNSIIENDLPKIKPGVVCTGVIVRTTDKDIYVDIKHKDYVVCPKSKENPNIVSELTVDTEVDVTIIHVQDNPYFNIEGNISAIYESNVRDHVDELIQRQEPVIAYVDSWTPAGFILKIDIGGVNFTAFMPNTIAGVNRLASPDEILHQDIKVILESFSHDNGTFIASRKRFLETLIPDMVKTLEPGMELFGEVTGTTAFGIFVEFNECLTAMIHKANLNPEWTSRLENNSIPIKTKIPFKIKEIIKTKVILTQVDKYSIWDDIKVGNKYKGTVNSLQTFGVIVKLDAETKGLIHETELKSKSLKPVIGQEIEVKVLTIDRLNRKISLQPII
jgi:ribosomal protein S1